MLYLFFLISLILTALCCTLSSIPWPTYIWCIPLMAIGFFAAELLLFLIVLAISSIFVDTKNPPQTRSRYYHRLVQFTIGLIASFGGARVTVEGEELIPKNTRFLFVCNHRSSFDPLITVWALRKHELSFIAKPSILNIPIAGKLIYRDFFMAIDRENNREALKTILRAVDLVKNDTASIGIYPEGTRSHDGNMLPFRNGAFKIAQKAKAPIVVAVIEGTENIAHRAPFRSTDVRLKICSLIDAETAAGNTTDIGETVREIMLAELGH